MAKENIHQRLEVFYEKVDDCPLRNREFNFFEMVYVLSGRGKHCINGNKIRYKKEDLFLISPNDSHEFELEGACEFIVIRFNQDYIKAYPLSSINHIECLLYNASHLSGSLLQYNSDKKIIASLIKSLKQTILQKLMYDQDLIDHLVNAVIVVTARNIARIKPENMMVNTDDRISEILNYIQKHIRQPDFLKISVIAENFAISNTYLGTYFRKQCNETLQHYISNYKMRLIEHRLRFSDKRVHEIAEEFGFTDESHINKFFKKYHKMTLAQYRRSQANSMQVTES